MKATLNLGLFIFITLITFNSYSQNTAPSIQWEQTFGYEYNDEAYQIIQTKDLGFAICGYYKTTTRSDNFWILKLDNGGNLIWENQFGGVKQDIATGIAENIDKSLSVCGFNYPKEGGPRNILVQRNITRKKQLFKKTYGGRGKEGATAIVAIEDNYNVVCGYSKTSTHSPYKFWLFKISKYGDVIWDKTYGKDQDNIPKSIAQTHDKGFIVCGNTLAKSKKYWDIRLIKLFSNGVVEWEKKYEYNLNDEANSVVQTLDTGYVVCGSTVSKDTSNIDIYVFKVDKKGNKIWEQTFGGEQNEEANSICQTKDGGYVLCGYTESKGSGLADFWIIKLDANGKKIWDKTIGGKESDIANCIIQTDDGGYAVCGGTFSKGAGLWDIWIVKLN